MDVAVRGAERAHALERGDRVVGAARQPQQQPATVELVDRLVERRRPRRVVAAAERGAHRAAVHQRLEACDRLAAF